MTMNALRPLPTTLLRTGLRLRVRSTATTSPLSLPLAASRQFSSSHLLLSNPPFSAPASHHALHNTAKLSDPGRVEHSTALLERQKTREEEASEVNLVGEDVEKPAGGRGSEGVHFKQADHVLAKVHDLQDPSRTGNWTISHPVYTSEELRSVKVVRREQVTLSDKITAGMVKLSRTCYDLITGYTFRHRPIPPSDHPMTLQQLRDGNHVMTPEQWLARCLFLESIAGVPGMVAGMLRHLRSLRLMRRDGGWINTLMAEAENERMHLLTFMTIKQPSPFFRAMILGAQGVFFNLFFLAYLVSPKSAHRFVGYLEEEACLTYTLCLEEMDKGRLPEWKEMPAPAIAIDYWRLPEKSTMQDVILSIRADESAHRFVNHSYASLDQKRDFSPFALKEPSAVLKGTKPGFTREEAAEFVRQAHREVAE